MLRTIWVIRSLILSSLHSAAKTTATRIVPAEWRDLLFVATSRTADPSDRTRPRDDSIERGSPRRFTHSECEIEASTSSMLTTHSRRIHAAFSEP